MLNGEERFVMRSISRNDIAAMLNDVIDAKQLTVPLFGEGDPRLTSRLCGTFVDRLSSVYEGAFGEEKTAYAEQEVVYTFLLVYMRDHHPYPPT